MKAKLRILMRKESFFPSWIGIFVNTFYFARRGLADAMMRYSKSLSGVLLDVGCGTKPYQSLFDVDEYVGFDIDSENTRKRGIADYFYDGSCSLFLMKNSMPSYVTRCSSMFSIRTNFWALISLRCFS